MLSRISSRSARCLLAWSIACVKISPVIGWTMLFTETAITRPSPEAMPGESDNTATGTSQAAKRNRKLTMGAAMVSVVRILPPL